MRVARDLDLVVVDGETAGGFAFAHRSIRYQGTGAAVERGRRHEHGDDQQRERRAQPEDKPW